MPDKNFGGATAIFAQGPGYNQRILAKFDVSGELPAITSARLRMQASTGSGTDQAFKLYRLTRNWVEGTGDFTMPADGATYNTYDGTNARTTPGGDYDAGSGVAATLTWTSGATAPPVCIEGLEDIGQYWMDNPSENYGLIILKDTSADSFRQYAREHRDWPDVETPDRYLALDIVSEESVLPIPEPSMMVLVALGSVGALVRRRR